MTQLSEVSKQPRSWGFLGSLGFSVLAHFAYFYGVFAVFPAMIISGAVSLDSSPEFVQSLAEQGIWRVAIASSQCVLTLAVIWIAIRIARRSFAEYLALVWPRTRDLAGALAVMLVALHILGFIGWCINEPEDAGVITTFMTARNQGQIFPLLVTLCIGAPIAEELVVRGFLFRGWCESFLGVTGTIVLSSAIWAATHTQYNWFGMFNIFVIGLLLSYFRYRSGSTLLTVMVHSAISLYVTFGLAMWLPAT